jgi:hypothetical protein
MALDQLFLRHDIADVPYIARFPRRLELINKIGARNRFDLVLLNGGLEAALLARLATFNGLSVLLASEEDLVTEDEFLSPLGVWGTGYKLVHLLQTLIACSQESRKWNLSVPHHTSKAGIYVSVSRDFSFASLTPRLINFATSFFGSDACSKIKVVSHSELPCTLGGSSVYLKSDLVIGDRQRIYREVMSSAIQEGAYCINHLAVQVLYNDDESARIMVRDRRGDAVFPLQAGLVVQYAQPAVHERHCVQRFVYRADTDSIPFQVLLTDLSEQSNVRVTQFKSLVTVDVISKTPELSKSNEFREDTLLVKNLQSHSYLKNRSLLYTENRYEFNRNIQTKSKFDFRSCHVQRGGTFLSNRHANMLFSSILKYSRVAKKPIYLDGRMLPGGFGINRLEAFYEEGKRRQLPEQLLHNAVSRFGGIVLQFLDQKGFLEPLGDLCLSGEVDFVVLVEQASTIDEVISRLSLKNDPERLQRNYQLLIDYLETCKLIIAVTNELDGVISKVSNLGK